MDGHVVKAALLDAAEDILANVGIEIDSTAGTTSWPDPVKVPYGPRPVNPDMLIALARAVSASRARAEKIFNVGSVEVVRPEGLLGGERWVQLRCHYAGDGSPLLMQMPERVWMEVLEAEPRTHCTLENCGHMRQLDAIVDLLGMHRGGISVLDELRKRLEFWEKLETEWTDVGDEWTYAIREAFPTRSGSHDEYGVAMQMVGHRHSKGKLVALVNWLLVRLKDEASLRVQVDELTAQRDAFGQKAHQLQERAKELEAVVGPAQGIARNAAGSVVLSATVYARLLRRFKGEWSYDEKETLDSLADNGWCAEREREQLEED